MALNAVKWYTRAMHRFFLDGLRPTLRGTGILALLALGAAPGGAGAHAVLDRAEPRVDSAFTSSPAQVRLWFTGALEPAYSRVRVVDEAGQRVDRGDGRVDPSHRGLLRVSLPPLSPGRYRVIWRILSVDSHVTEGDFEFRIAP